MPYYYNMGEILQNFSAILLISRFETTSGLAAAILNFLSQKNSPSTTVCCWLCLLVETIEIRFRI
jgi:hypothetical protein